MCATGEAIQEHTQCERRVNNRSQRHQVLRNLRKRCPNKPKPGPPCRTMRHDPSLDVLPSRRTMPRVSRLRHFGPTLQACDGEPVDLLSQHVYCIKHAIGRYYLARVLKTTQCCSRAAILLVGKRKGQADSYDISLVGKAHSCNHVADPLRCRELQSEKTPDPNVGVNGPKYLIPSLCNYICSQGTQY